MSKRESARLLARHSGETERRRSGKTAAVATRLSGDLFLYTTLTRRSGELDECKRPEALPTVPARANRSGDLDGGGPRMQSPMPAERSWRSGDPEPSNGQVGEELEKRRSNGSETHSARRRERRWFGELLV